MFDATDEKFRKQVLDLSNQISVFRRVTVNRNQELIDEESRFNIQLSNTTEDASNIRNVHYLYIKDEKEHIINDIKSELLYLNIIQDTYNKARTRVVELAKQIKNISDPVEKNIIKDELRIVLPFVEMYESYYKELKTMQDALKGYKNNTDRYLDYISSNKDLFKDIKTDTNIVKNAIKESDLEFDIKISDNKISIMAGYASIKLDNPEEFDIDTLIEEDLDYFLLNFLEEVSNNTRKPVDEISKKKFNVKIDGNIVENVNEESFAITILNAIKNKKKKDEIIKEEKKKEQRRINQNVPDKPVKNEDNKNIITLDRIMSNITKGIKLEKGDDWKFSASNIKVNENFKKKVCTGNALYTIVALAPSIISYPIELIHKGIGKIAYRKKVDKRVRELSKRINELSDDELKIIYESYKGGNLKNYQKMPIVNTLLQDKITSWINDKVSKIDIKMVSIYNTILSDYKRMTTIVKHLKNDNLSEEEYLNLQEEYYALAYGKASLIKEYNELVKAKLDYEIGGINGFNHSIKAFKSGMSHAGFRFRSIKKESDELNEEQARAKEEEIKGIVTNDDFMALSGFIKREKLLKENSKIEEGLLMDRDIGLRSYNPLMKPLNYEADPFVTDLIRSIVLVTSGINIYNTIQRANSIDSLKQLNASQKDIIERQQRQIEELSSDLDHAKELGSQITNKSDAIINERVAQIYESNLAHANTLERAVLDKTNWHSTGEEYKVLDNAAHHVYNSAYDISKNRINEITDLVSTGHITHQEAMQELTKLSNSMEMNFANNYKSIYGFVADYAKAHPEFELTAPTEGLKNVISTNMNINIGNNAVDDAFKIASEISNIKGLSIYDINSVANNLVRIERLNNVLPNESMIPSLTNSLSAAILAIGVKSRMNKYNTYDHSYELEDVGSISDDDIEEIENFDDTEEISNKKGR